MTKLPQIFHLRKLQSHLNFSKLIKIKTFKVTEKSGKYATEAGCCSYSKNRFFGISISLFIFDTDSKYFKMINIII